MSPEILLNTARKNTQRFKDNEIKEREQAKKKYILECEKKIRFISKQGGSEIIICDMTTNDGPYIYTWDSLRLEICEHFRNDGNGFQIIPLANNEYKIVW